VSQCCHDYLLWLGLNYLEVLYRINKTENDRKNASMGNGNKGGFGYCEAVEFFVPKAVIGRN